MRGLTPLATLVLFAVCVTQVQAITPPVGINLDGFTVLASGSVLSNQNTTSVLGDGSGGVPGSPGRTGAGASIAGVSSLPGGNQVGTPAVNSALAELEALKNALYALVPDFVFEGTVDLRTLDIDGPGGVPPGTLVPGVYQFNHVHISDGPLADDLNFAGVGEYVLNISGSLTVEGLVFQDDAAPPNYLWNVGGGVSVGNVIGSVGFIDGILLARAGAIYFGAIPRVLVGKILTDAGDVVFNGANIIVDCGFAPNVLVNGAAVPQFGAPLNAVATQPLNFTVSGVDPEAGGEVNGDFKLARTGVSPPSAAAAFSTPANSSGVDSGVLNEVFTPGPALSGTQVTVSYRATDQSGAVNDFEVVMSIAGIPDIGVSPAAVDFGTVPQLVPQARTLEVLNTSVIPNSPLTITSITSSSGDCQVGTPSLPLVLGNGSHVGVPITLTPPGPGPFSCSITIRSDDPDEDPLVVPVTATVLATLPPDIAVAPAAVAFGAVSFFGPHQRNLQILNTASDPNSVLTVTGIISTDPDCQVQLPSLPLALGAGANVDVPVIFTPSAVGPFLCHLQISSNDPDENPLLVPITANVLPTPPPDIAASPAALDFGNVSPFGPHQRVLQILNEAVDDEAILQLTGITSTDSDCEVQPPTLPLTLRAGGSVVVPVTFRPSGPGPFSCEIQVASNDPDEDPLVVLVTANVLDVPPPEIAAAPAALSFGTVSPAGSHQRVLTLLNTASDPNSVLTVSGILSTNAAFTVAPPTLPLSIQPGSSVAVPVTFTPTSSGLSSGQLQISSNDPDDNPLIVPVTAQVAAADPGDLGAPEFVEFPTTVVGKSATRTVTLHNSGNVLMRVNLSLAGGGSYALTDAPPSGFLLLESGGVRTLEIRFKPTSAGREITGTLNLSVVDPLSPGTVFGSDSVHLCGEGVAAGARVLVTGGGVPLAVVDRIILQRRNKGGWAKVVQVDAVPLSEFLRDPCSPIRFHLERGLTKVGRYRFVVKHGGVTLRPEFSFTGGTFTEVVANF